MVFSLSIKQTDGVLSVSIKPTDSVLAVSIKPTAVVHAVTMKPTAVVHAVTTKPTDVVHAVTIKPTDVVHAVTIKPTDVVHMVSMQQPPQQPRPLLFPVKTNTSGTAIRTLLGSAMTLPFTKCVRERVERAMVCTQPCIALAASCTAVIASI